MAARAHPGRAAYLDWLATYLWLPEFVLALVGWRAAIRRWPLFAALSVVGLVTGYPWDRAGFRLRCWSLNEDRYLGHWVGALPIEEWLFLATAPWLFGAGALLAAHVRDVEETYLFRARRRVWLSSAAGHRPVRAEPLTRALARVRPGSKPLPGLRCSGGTRRARSRPLEGF